ncbi:MAG: hypothetical protein A3F16_02400 [Deltaproteobacteria bacterium RIFCSPHIGHO2_12_FULL_43_9]|nr:MAG: hypothetical protein A3F16_02400 [Deltaproteobacteria bacterium RIFCSPHIGHO2_12_FULL_43_9]
MRYFLGLFTVVVIISVTAFIFAEEEWILEPGASYTIEEDDKSGSVSITSAGEDKESASLHCLAEGAIKLLQNRYKNYSCKPCQNGAISSKSFQIKYPAETEKPEIIEHKIGGKTVYIARCNVSSASGALSCSSCGDPEE